MLKEEKLLRKRLHELLGINAQLVGKYVTALVRAVREDEREYWARYVEEEDGSIRGKQLAAAIRGGK